MGCNGNCSCSKRDLIADGYAKTVVARLNLDVPYDVKRKIQEAISDAFCDGRHFRDEELDEKREIQLSLF